MIKDLVLKNRTYRRFFQDVKFQEETLLELIDLARLTSSGANFQSLKYFLSYEEKTNGKIFPYLKWAGYLTDWDGPEEGEKPSAYIVMLADREISPNHFWDHGLAAQSILLGAVEKGFGGCMFHGIDREGLKKELGLGERFDIVMVIALGKPREKVVLEEVKNPKEIKYWRDSEGVHHVPKRKLQDLIVN